MKILKNIAFTLVLLIISSQAINGQDYIQVPGRATDVVISPKDGNVYIVGTSKNVFKYNEKENRFKSFGKQTRNVKKIAIHPNGTVYMVSTSNDVYYDYKGYWNKVSGIKANSIHIDKKGNIRVLNMSGKLYKLFKGSWKYQTLANKNTKGFKQVIGYDSKTLYARFKDDSFRQFKGGKWIILKGNPIDISIASSGRVSGVCEDKRIYEWHGNKWFFSIDTRNIFKKHSCNYGKIWGITDGNLIYNYVPNTKPYNLKDELKNKYSGTYKISIDKIGSLKGNEFYGTMGVYLETKVKSVKSRILPLNNKSNRYFDVPKSKARKASGPKIKINRAINNPGGFTSYYSKASLDIDKIREFKLMGDVANKNATFDFQFNIKGKFLGGELGKWERVKLNIEDIILNKYYSFSTASGGAVVFKIEKL